MNNQDFPELAKNKGHCARSVRLGLEAAGGDTTGYPELAKDWSKTLIGMGFQDVTTDPNYPNLSPGDIVVMQPVPALGPSHQQGHIAVWNGTNWVSDYYQNNFQPYESNLGIDLTDWQIFHFPCNCPD